jgi:hypothetical protein
MARPIIAMGNPSMNMHGFNITGKKEESVASLLNGIDFDKLFSLLTTDTKLKILELLEDDKFVLKLKKSCIEDI